MTIVCPYVLAVYLNTSGLFHHFTEIYASSGSRGRIFTSIQSVV